MLNLPHFIHIGYPKTASTWLQDVFKGHQDICFVYKPKFFQHDDCFNKGKEFYLDLFQPKQSHKVTVDSDEAYAKGEHYAAFGWDCCYKPKHPRSLGELMGKAAQPWNKELIARRMHETTPNAKILIVVRNQVDWLASMYKHKIKKGKSWSFEELLSSDYFSAAFYSSTVELYFKLFGRENVLVLFYEELKKNPVSFLDKISSFFGISQFDYSQVNRKTKLSITNRGAKIMRKANRFPILPKITSFADRKLFSKIKDSEIFSSKQKERLTSLYKEDNKKLAELLNCQKLYE